MDRKEVVLEFTYKVRVVLADPLADPREDDNVERMQRAMQLVGDQRGTTVELMEIEEG